MTPDLPQGSVIITPAEMYHEMQAIGKKVDHLAAIMDPALQEVRSDISETKNQIAAIVVERKAETAELRRRVGALENWRWFLAGLGVIGGPATGVLASIILR